jgi:hypothetical protein
MTRGAVTKRVILDAFRNLNESNGKDDKTTD